MYHRTVPTRSERRCSTDIRTQSVRAHHTKPILLLHWLPIRWRVQFKYCCMHACSCHRTLSSVSGEHRATSYTVAFRSATVIFRFLCTADKDQVRRAGLHLSVEHTAAPRHISGKQSIPLHVYPARVRKYGVENIGQCGD